MKNMIKMPALLVGLMLILAGITQTAKAQQEDVSLQSFYDELSPYGQWIQDPQYGYVWRPDVDQDEFRPYYTNGRWAMTEYGNTWVSNYDWGWAPFHYGRWIYNSYNNWVWLPDTTWGPAWVSWRSGGGNYGWAPLGPSINIGINIGRGGYRIPDMCWNFIPYGNIYSNSYPRYYGGRNRVYIQNTVIINNTYVRNNRTYYTGPRAEEVRRATNQNVTVYNVNRGSRPGASRIENNNINIYTPRSGRDNGNSAPRNVVQGNISRGPVGRDNNMTANRGDNRNGNSVQNSRGGRDGNVDQNNRTYGNDNRVNGNMSTRPSRGDVSGVQTERDNRGRVGVSPNADRGNAVGSRPSVFDRRTAGGTTPSERVDRNNQQQAEAQSQQRTGRNREMSPDQSRTDQRVERQQAQPQQRMERPQSQPQQTVERPQPQQRMERPQPQQRMERPQAQPQQQRSERTQSAPQQRSSGGSESRGGGNSGGRPGRG